jgi:hypothetical protein
MAAAAINAGLRKQQPPVVKSNDSVGKTLSFQMAARRLASLRYSASSIGFMMYGRAQ